MKRFHVNVAVADITKSTAFYTGVFGIEPTLVKQDYAKWLLDEPRLNFSISRATGETGIRHLGLQFDSDADLGSIRDRLDTAGAAVWHEPEAECCYARSDKTWLRDPDGVTWEMFRTHGQIESFGGDRENASIDPPAEKRRCCA